MEILKDKIKLDNNDSYILFEQGGIGKTSQMKAVFQSYALSHKDGIVPIFVDCKTIDFNRKQPLLTHILLEFCGEDCSDNYENSIVRLENMLTKANSKYKYVFFIDGINECENNKYLVVQDIAKLLKSPSNKIIVSSRINEDDIGLKDFKRLKVKEFTDAQIVTFLNSKGFKDNGNDVELNRLNPSLLKILRVPMFLRLFVETYSADNIFPEMYTGNIVRKADLLQAFIDKIFDDKKEQHSSENDPEYIKIKFALERYLPALAYEMMLMHKYSINNEVFKNLRTQVFNSDYFERFENENEEIFKNVSSIKKINNICIEEFSLLNKSNDNYAFSHQVWQDFFCGKFYELCIKYDVLEPFENAMPESVKQFIGEIIGECDFENVIELERAKESPLNQLLQKHNLQQKENSKFTPIQTRNIIEIMKTSRNGNITGDYSNCNLTQSSFIYSSILNANFENAIAEIKCFFPDGFQNDIQYVAISQNKKEFLVIDKEWYMRVINFKFGPFYENNIKFTIDINNQKKIEIDKIFTMDDYSFILRLLTEETKRKIKKNPKTVYILVKRSEINIIGGEQQFAELQAIHQIKEINNEINTNICYGNSISSTYVEFLLGSDYKAIKKNNKIFLYNMLNEFIGIYPIEHIGFPRCYVKKRNLLIGFYGANVYIFDFETLKVKSLLGKCQYIGEDFDKNHSCYHLFSDGRLRLLKAENEQYRVIDIIEKFNYEDKIQDRTINKITKTWLQEIDILPINCIGAKFINMQIVDDYENIIPKEMLIKFYKTVFINGGIIEK